MKFKRGFIKLGAAILLTGLLVGFSYVFGLTLGAFLNVI